MMFNLQKTHEFVAIRVAAGRDISIDLQAADVCPAVEIGRSTDVGRAIDVGRAGYVQASNEASAQRRGALDIEFTGDGGIVGDCQVDGLDASVHNKIFAGRAVLGVGHGQDALAAGKLDAVDCHADVED